MLFFTGTAELWQLMALMAINGVAFALLFPAAVGLVPLVVERERLQSANALLSLAQSSAFALGGIAAGLIVGFAGGGSNVVGAGWAIAIDAATFFAAALLIAGVDAQPQSPTGDRDEASSLWRELREGWDEFVSHRWLWTIVVQWSLVLMGYHASLSIVGPVVAERFLGGAQAWGWIAFGLGLGLVAGGLLGMRLFVRRPMFVGTLSVFAFAIPLALLALQAPVAVIACGAFLSGLGMELFSVLWFTALHTHVAPDKLSRVSSYDILGSIAFVPVGEISAGLLIGWIGASTTLWIAVALVVVPTALVLLVPEVRRLESAHGHA